MLVSEIATRVKRTFGDEAGAQITDADILRWINDAQREIAVNNDLLQTVATTSIVASADQYTLPPDLLTIRSIRYKGKRLVFLSSEDNQNNLNSYDNSTGEPSHYTLFANKIDLFPVPASAAVGGLQIYYTRNPVPVDDVADTPELPLQYHNQLVNYCVAQAYELDDDFDSYKSKMQIFQDGVDKLKGQLEWQPQDVYPSVSAGIADYGEYYG